MQQAGAGKRDWTNIPALGRRVACNRVDLLTAWLPETVFGYRKRMGWDGCRFLEMGVCVCPRITTTGRSGWILETMREAILRAFAGYVCDEG